MSEQKCNNADICDIILRYRREHNKRLPHQQYGNVCGCDICVDADDALVPNDCPPCIPVEQAAEPPTPVDLDVIREWNRQYAPALTTVLRLCDEIERLRRDRDELPTPALSRSQRDGLDKIGCATLYHPVDLSRCPLGRVGDIIEAGGHKCKIESIGIEKLGGFLHAGTTLAWMIGVEVAE